MLSTGSGTEGPGCRSGSRRARAGRGAGGTGRGSGTAPNGRLPGR